MRLFRVVDPEYASAHHAFSGEGAIKGGRWNERGTRTVYASASTDTAIAEKAFYSIISNVYIHKNEKRLTDDERDDLLDKRHVLIEATLDIHKNPRNDFTDKRALSSSLRGAGLPNRKPSESVLCPWELLPEQWTSALGSHCARQTEKGIHVLSARSKKGRNHVFYEQRLFGNIRIERKDDLLLSAADNNGSKKWNGKGKYSLDHVFFEVPGRKKSGVLKIEDKRMPGAVLTHRF